MTQEDNFLHDVSNVTPPLSAGQLLRSYREALGLEVQAIATHLHVPVSKLHALEEDRLEDLPDTVFARSLALAVCRHLNRDAAAVLQLLPEYDANRLAVHDERGLNSPIRRPALSTQPLWPAVLHRLTSMRWIAWVVMLAAALIGLWPEIQAMLNSHESASVVESRPMAAPVVEEAASESTAGQMVITPVQPVFLQQAPATPDASAAGETNAC
jgi:cytoskeleton protein RodZ